MQASSRPACPRCGSSEIKKNGPNDHGIQRFKCKSCGKSFPEHWKVEKGLSEEIVKNYLFGKVSFDYLLTSKQVNYSKTTLHRRIMEKVKGIPGWNELLKRKVWNHKKITVMGIDMTNLNAERKKNYYIEVYDVTTHDTIAYPVCYNKKAKTITNVLLRLKDAGYIPDIVVTDLAGELVESVRKVFPNAVIQGCIIHLTHRLDKKLPNKNYKRGMTTKQREEYKEKQDFYQRYKFLAECIAASKNNAAREQHLKELIALNSDKLYDKKTERAYNKLVEELNNNYYRTEDEYEKLQRNRGICKKNYIPIKDIRYNNFCESHMRYIEKIGLRMNGFKKVSNTSCYINAYWYFKREEKGVFQEWQKKVRMYNTRPLVFNCKKSLTGMSKTKGIPIEVLIGRAKTTHRKVIGDHTFDEKELGNLRNLCSKLPQTMTLKFVMKKLHYDQLTVTELLRQFGFKLEGQSLDPSDIIVTKR